MAIHFNHTILSAHDSKASAIFLAEMLNLPAPRRWGPFQMVVTENGANLDYMDTDGEITPQHYDWRSRSVGFGRERSGAHGSRKGLPAASASSRCLS